MIRLTAGNDGADIWVDPRAIQTVRALGGQTRIALDGGNAIQVKEAVEAVLALLPTEIDESESWQGFSAETKEESA